MRIKVCAIVEQAKAQEGGWLGRAEQQKGCSSPKKVAAAAARLMSLGSRPLLPVGLLSLVKQVR